MAITFNPLEKVIELDSYSVSERQIWTAFVDWSVEGDNLKYGVGMTQLGGLAPVALYIFLAEGWRVRPLALAGITTITGNLLTSNNESPIEQAENVVQVNMETPVQAVALNSGGNGSGVSVAQIQSIIDNLHNFNPNTDIVANVTTVGTTTTNSDMRGTDSANTVVPDNTTVETILTDLSSYTASSLRKLRDIELDTDDLATNQSDWVTADVSALTLAQNTKLMSLNTDNLDVAVSTRATKADADQALADYDVDTKTNVKPSIPV